MEYSIKYCKNKYDEEMTEYWIWFKPNYPALSAFLEAYEEKNVRIVVKVVEDMLDEFNITKLGHIPTNMVIALPYTDKGRQHFKAIRENTTIPMYFMRFAEDMETINELLEWGVSDVIPIEDLCFELDKVAAAAHKKGARVRIFPNVAQYGENDEDEEPFYRFFVRPEEVETYAPFVDVFEFLYDVGDEITSDHMGPWYYKVYEKDKQWFGDLGECIEDFPLEHIDNRTILPIAEFRLKCGKRCKKGSTCRICESAMNCAATMEKHNLYFKKSTELFDIL